MVEILGRIEFMSLTDKNPDPDTSKKEEFLKIRKRKRAKEVIIRV